MKTTARGRLWGLMGAVLHWTYFTPFRLQRELWRYSIIYVALIGCVMCLSGLVVGVWRYSLSRRFRLQRCAVAFALLRVHVVAPLRWTSVRTRLIYVGAQRSALSHPVGLGAVHAPQPSRRRHERRAASSGRGDERPHPNHTCPIRFSFAAKELEILQFQGRAVALAYRAPELNRSAEWTNPDLQAMQSPQLTLEHRLVWLDAPHDGALQRIEDAAVVGAARDPMPGAVVVVPRLADELRRVLLRSVERQTVAGLRVQQDDPDRTTFYVDPQSALISLRHTRLTRLNRWLYNGLHSFDFPGLYFSRPAWDILLIALSAGGIALTVTTMAPAWRRLKRNFRNRGLQGRRRQRASRTRSVERCARPAASMMKSRILASRLETPRLEGKVSFRDVFRHPAERTAKNSPKVERQCRPAFVARRLDPVTGNELVYPGPVLTHVKLRPGSISVTFHERRRRKPRLADQHPGSDRERPAAEPPDAGDRRGPFVPSIECQTSPATPVPRTRQCLW